MTTHPHFSPDGNRIVYVSDAKGNNDIWQRRPFITLQGDLYGDADGEDLEIFSQNYGTPLLNP